MNIVIQNENLRLVIDSFGAQMMELSSSRGVQYLWNGEKKYWEDRAPVLFPFVGRLTNRSYTFHGKAYQMDIHGFASRCEFVIEEQSPNSVMLKLSDSEQTRTMYPFSFVFRVMFRLRDWSLETSYIVENCDEKEMYFGLGGHPGFNVPFYANTRFEEYFLRFDQVCYPDRVGFTSDCLLNGIDERFPLIDDQILPLKHELFNNDAIVLKNMSKSVTLCSKKAGRSITVHYPQMQFLGLWHWPKTDAPYICIEPWTSLPSRKDVIEEFSCKSDMIHLLPGETYKNTWYVTISEE